MFILLACHPPPLYPHLFLELYIYNVYVYVYLSSVEGAKRCRIKVKYFVTSTRGRLQVRLPDMPVIARIYSYCMNFFKDREYIQFTLIFFRDKKHGDCLNNCLLFLAISRILFKIAPASLFE